MSTQTKNILILTVYIFLMSFNGVINSAVYKSPLLYWAFELFFWIVIPGTCLYFYYLNEENKLSQLGLTTTILGKNSILLTVLIGVALCPVTYVINIFATLFSSSQSLNNPIFQYHWIIPETNTTKAMTVIYLSVTAGVVEELFFRGLFYRVCKTPVFYIFLSSFFFGVIHWESGINNAIYAFIFGCFFSVLYLELKNIWPLIIAHTFIDLVMFS